MVSYGTPWLPYVTKNLFELLQKLYMLCEQLYELYKNFICYAKTLYVVQKLYIL